MESKHVGALAAVVGIVGFVVQYVPSRLLNRWLQGGPGGGLPAVGTTGQTVVTYNLLVASLGPLVTVLLAVWLGYRVGDRLDMTAEYRQFGVAVAAGSLVSALVAWVAMTLVGGNPPTTPADALITLAILVRLVVSISLVVTVGVFAGAALSHFRTSEEPPGRASEEESGPPTGADAVAHDQ